MQLARPSPHKLSLCILLRLYLAPRAADPGHLAVVAAEQDDEGKYSAAELRALRLQHAMSAEALAQLAALLATEVQDVQNAARERPLDELLAVLGTAVPALPPSATMGSGAAAFTTGSSHGSLLCAALLAQLDAALSSPDALVDLLEGLRTLTQPPSAAMQAVLSTSTAAALPRPLYLTGAGSLSLFARRMVLATQALSFASVASLFDGTRAYRSAFTPPPTLASTDGGGDDGVDAGEARMEDEENVCGGAGAAGSSHSAVCVSRAGSGGLLPAGMSAEAFAARACHLSTRQMQLHLARCADQLGGSGLGGGDGERSSVPQRTWAAASAAASALAAAKDDAAASSARPLPTPESERELALMLAHFPDLPRAHLLRYLCAARRRDFGVAVDSLHRYCDYAMRDGMGDADAQVVGDVAGLGGARAIAAVGAGSVFRFGALAGVGAGAGGSGPSGSGPEGNHRLQYAALSLAALHHTFGHVTEALSALQESVRIAQQQCDHACAAFALAWIGACSSAARNPVAPVVVSRCLSRARELRLPLLHSAALLQAARHDLHHGLLQSEGGGDGCGDGGGGSGGLEAEAREAAADGMRVAGSLAGPDDGGDDDDDDDVRAGGGGRGGGRRGGAGAGGGAELHERQMARGHLFRQKTLAVLERPSQAHIIGAALHAAPADFRAVQAAEGEGGAKGAARRRGHAGGMAGSGSADANAEGDGAEGGAAGGRGEPGRVADTSSLGLASALQLRSQQLLLRAEAWRTFGASSSARLAARMHLLRSAVRVGAGAGGDGGDVAAQGNDGAAGAARGAAFATVVSVGPDAGDIGGVGTGAGMDAFHAPLRALLHAQPALHSQVSALAASARGRLAGEAAALRESHGDDTCTSRRLEGAAAEGVVTLRRTTLTLLVQRAMQRAELGCAEAMVAMLAALSPCANAPKSRNFDNGTAAAQSVDSSSSSSSSCCYGGGGGDGNGNKSRLTPAAEAAKAAAQQDFSGGSRFGGDPAAVEAAVEARALSIAVMVRCPALLSATLLGSRLLLLVPCSCAELSHVLVRSFARSLVRLLVSSRHVRLRPPHLD